jgi:hypothetical protein
MDKDVYIEYGDNYTIGDDVKTSATGLFEFKNMLPGKYRIYYYSEDSTNHNISKIPIIKEITISNNDKSIDLGSVVLYKTIDYDEGTSMAKGVIGGLYWTKNFKAKIGTSGYAQDYDVFLIYNNQPYNETRIRTLYNGTYTFPNLIKGKYQLYTYRFTSYTTETITKDFEITKENEIIPIDSITVNLETNL